MQEWARAENEYADRHGPQEELLTTEDLAGLNQQEQDTDPTAPASSAAGLPQVGWQAVHVVLRQVCGTAM